MGDPREPLLDSVSREIARTARVPVLVVPEVDVTVPSEQ